MISWLSLNSCVTFTGFKIKTVSLVFGSIRKGDFMFLIDREEASFQIPIHLHSVLYLWICQFNVSAFLQLP